MTTTHATTTLHGALDFFECDECGDFDGQRFIHHFPEVGQRVIILRDCTGRTPSTETFVTASAGETGVVSNFIPEAHQVHVVLDGGLELWVQFENLGLPDWQPAYEVEGCTVISDYMGDAEVITTADHLASFWTVYLIDPDGFAVAIADFDTRADAEDCRHQMENGV